MVTYSDMIQLGIRIVGIISRFIQANNKKKQPPNLPRLRLLLLAIRRGTARLPVAPFVFLV